MTTLNTQATELVKAFAKENKYSFTKLETLFAQVAAVSTVKRASNGGRKASAETVALRDQVAAFVAELNGKTFTTADVVAKFGCSLVDAGRAIAKVEGVAKVGAESFGKRGKKTVVYAVVTE